MCGCGPFVVNCFQGVTHAQERRVIVPVVSATPKEVNAASIAALLSHFGKMIANDFHVWLTWHARGP
jgi:hypothetical protein